MPDRMKPLPTGDFSNVVPPIDSYTFNPEAEYIYFSDSDDHPFDFAAEDFRILNAWWLSDASMLAYSDPNTVYYWFKQAGFSEVETFSGETTRCYVAIRKEYIFVVFRGTRTPKNEDIGDV